MGIYKRLDSEYWWGVSYRHDVKPYSTGTPDRKLAEKIHAKRLADALSYKHGFAPSNITLPELLAQWLEYVKNNKKAWDLDNYRIPKIVAYFGTIKASALKTNKIEQFRLDLQSQNIAPSTVNRYCALIRSAYNWGIREGLVDHNPMEGVRFYNEAERARLRYLTPEERTKLINSCSAELRPIVIIALSTGMRQNEILSLRWQHVDLTNKLIYVYRSKSGTPRHVPLTNEVINVLTEIPKVNEFVFQERIRGHYRTDWAKALEVSSIADLHFHDLRHDFASHMVALGKDLYTIASILGHSSLQMTKRYSHLSPTGLRSAISDFPRLSENHYVNTTVDKKPKDQNAKTA